MTIDDESVVKLLQENYTKFILYCNIGLIIAISSILNVVSQQVFNLINSKRMMPFDKWSLIDSIAAVVNLIVLIVFYSFKPADFIGDQYRTEIILLNVIQIIVSWTRFISFFFVISSLSKLLLTLYKMLIACATYLLINMMYLVLLAPIFGILLQEQNVNYYDYI